ncbi:MAG: LysM peptidoglycan-binding domain-containing protein [Thermonemataceae bacterium]
MLELRILTQNPDGSENTDEDMTFLAYILESDITQMLSIDYAKPKIDNDKIKYHFTQPERISLNIFLDSTGEYNDDFSLSVYERIQRFKTVTYLQNDELHEPNTVNIYFGEVSFTSCRLENSTVTYKKVSREGIVRSAVIAATFSSIPSLTAEENATRQSSPDLTHIRVVKAGDTLPLMCDEIYGDPSMYLAVAKANNIVNFRSLEEGDEIVFPPIKK